jgi:succinate-semialdehyde dehydrogenase/glutarate-semialdehyde dehydrogenase
MAIAAINLATGETIEVFEPLTEAGIEDKLAVAVANESQFGLGACIWTNQLAAQARAAEELEAGVVFVNGMVASDPLLPFGGVKESGYGRELSEVGICEFVNIKSVVVR